MNREDSVRFSEVPYIEKPRSTFYRPQKHLTTFSAGKLIPFYVEEVLPGDTHNIKTNALIRMLTPIYPVMDNAYIDVNYFFVPNRIIWDHWEAFQGDDQTTAWENPVEYETPQIEAPAGGWTKGTIADYMGIPIGISGLSVNALPFRAYCKIFNDWWRDENLVDSRMIHLDETTRTGSNGTGAGDTYVTTTELGGQPLQAAKFHDYFTSVLPKMQKSAGPTLIPMSIDSVAPVFAANGEKTGNSYGLANIPTDLRKYSEAAQAKMHADATTYRMAHLYLGKSKDAKPGQSTPTYNMWEAPSQTSGRAAVIKGDNSISFLTMKDATDSAALTSSIMSPVNLWADTAGLSLNATVNELRTAFAVQRILEAFARGGTRYTEILKNIWGVSAPDFRLQRAEYIGGTRVPINMDQVLQTSESNRSGTPLGETGAFSNTSFNDHTVEYSSFESGWIIGVAVIRVHHTYQQGLERFWTRKTKWDYYYPQMAYLSEQAVRLDEIYAQGTSDDETVFGYQERWAEYRYKPNRVSGEMRSTYTTPLDSWHYADYYTTAPALSAEWISEGDSEINRTLAVASNTADQFLADFYIENLTTRMMPVYSVPGLIDHF